MTRRSQRSDWQFVGVPRSGRFPHSHESRRSSDTPLLVVFVVATGAMIQLARTMVPDPCTHHGVRHHAPTMGSDTRTDHGVRHQDL